jgi:TATA-binding protein-associated factor Taf7
MLIDKKKISLTLLSTTINRLRERIIIGVHYIGNNATCEDDDDDNDDDDDDDDDAPDEDEDDAPDEDEDDDPDEDEDDEDVCADIVAGVCVSFTHYISSLSIDTSTYLCFRFPYEIEIIGVV